MPPRLPGLRTFQLCLRPTPRPAATPALVPIIQKANITRDEAKAWRRRDPYGWQQELQRKAANRERRKAKYEAEQEAKGNPVTGLGEPTPYVESFDSAGQSPLSKAKLDEDGNVVGEQHELPTSPHILGNMLTRDELLGHLSYAEALTKPQSKKELSLMEPGSWERERDAATDQKNLGEHSSAHHKAEVALKRIFDLKNSGGEMRKVANIRRCIEEFGRHKTDYILKPTPPSRDKPRYAMPKRQGPDTGSSEVQIALLTMKIRGIQIALDQPRGRKDVANRRNVRLLVHRRQKLLKYMQRKEGNSGRWTHMIEKLGLTPAMWEGEIVVP